MVDLLALFRELKIPDGSNSSALTAAAVEVGWQHRVARNIDDRPSILIWTSKRGDFFPTIELANLTISHNVKCRVTGHDGTSVEDQFSVITCTSDDHLVQEKFLSLLSPLIFAIGQDPSESKINELINGLVVLFRSMTQAPLKSLQGIWAELFLISNARVPALAANYWHSTPEEKYDFSKGKEKLEIKSSSSRSRTHHFSLEQLSPSNESVLLVCSLFVERSAGGPSIAELCADIRQQIGNDIEVLARFDRVFHSCIGNNWNTASDLRFDFELAKESIAFYRIEDIPKLHDPIPFGVSEVRFKSKLPDIGITPTEAAEIGSLFSVILPDSKGIRRLRKFSSSKARR